MADLLGLSTSLLSFTIAAIMGLGYLFVLGFPLLLLLGVPILFIILRIKFDSNKSHLSPPISSPQDEKDENVLSLGDFNPIQPSTNRASDRQGIDQGASNLA